MQSVDAIVCSARQTLFIRCVSYQCSSELWCISVRTCSIVFAASERDDSVLFCFYAFVSTRR